MSRGPHQGAKPRGCGRREQTRPHSRRVGKSAQPVKTGGGGRLPACESRGGEAPAPNTNDSVNLALSGPLSPQVDEHWLDGC